MKNDDERGQVGAWARRSRMAAGLTVEQAVARLSAEGTAADPSYVRAIESGSKRPRTDSDIVAALARAYRTTAPADAEPVTASSDIDRLVEVVRQQQASIDALRGLVETLLAEVRPKPAGGAAIRLPVPDDTFEESPLTGVGRDAAELAHDEMTGEGAPGPVAAPQLRSVPRTPPARRPRGCPR